MLLDHEDSQFTQHSLGTLKQSYYFDLIASQHPSSKMFKNRIQSTTKLRSKESSQPAQPKFQSQHSTQSDFKTASLQNLLLQKEQQIDLLQRKYIQAKSTQSKNKQGQNYMTGYADHAVNQLRQVSQWPNLLEEQQFLEYLQNFTQEMIYFINSLNDIFRLISNNSEVTVSRLTQADYIVQQLEKCQHSEVRETDLFNLRRVITQLYDSLTAITNSESQMNKLYRDYKKLCIDHSQLQVQYDKINQLREVQEKSMSTIKKQFRIQNEETQQTKKFLRREQHQNQEQSKRVTTLEQRLDILQGNETYKKDKDALRNIIDDMIKESELNKRKAFSKSQQVEKLEQQLNECKEKCSKLSRRCYLLERSLKTFGYTSYDINQKFIPRIPLASESSEEDSEGEQNFVFEQLEDIFLKGQIPRKLDFKMEKLSKREKDYVVDLMQNGASQMADVVLSMKDMGQQKNIMSLFLDQFVQFKLIAEKMSSFIRFLNESIELASLEEVLSNFAGTFPSLIQSEHANIWLIDQQNATFYTLDRTGERKTALIDTDIFLEVIKQQKPHFKRSSSKFVLYRCADTSSPVLVSNSLVLPILHHSSILGVITAANIVDIDYLMQNTYFLMILTALTMKGLLQQFSSVKVIKYQLKYKNLLFECFEDLSQQKTEFAFSQKLAEYASKLFGVEQTIFYFYEQHNLIRYKSELEYDSYPSTLGLAGHACRLQQNVIVSSISKHDAYHQRIDIDSIMPVFVIPILSSAIKKLELDSPLKKRKDEKTQREFVETVGVLEIALNQRVNLQQNDRIVEVHHLLSSNDTLQSMATMFSQVVTMGYKYMSHMSNLKK